VSLSLNA
jgi:hypothetical protein